MKIEIEFTSSYHATLKIDGREMTVESTPGMVTLEGIKDPETDSTLGGIIAGELYSRIGQFQQAWAIATEIDVDVDTWDTLSTEAADEAYARIW